MKAKYLWVKTKIARLFFGRQLVELAPFAYDIDPENSSRKYCWDIHTLTVLNTSTFDEYEQNFKKPNSNILDDR